MTTWRSGKAAARGELHLAGILRATLRAGSERRGLEEFIEDREVPLAPNPRNHSAHNGFVILGRHGPTLLGVLRPRDVK